ncbi:MAG TPA: SRPBCC family protein [Haliangium sp.]|nr:SRPBCC family protein [Haliangium sp.]
MGTQRFTGQWSGFGEGFASSRSLGQHVGRGGVQRAGHDAGRNVGQYERIASGVGGAALIFLGLRRFSLGGALAALGGVALLHRGVTGQCQVYRRFGVDTTREGLSRGVEVDRSITIARSPDEVYRFWRNFQNLSTFMKHLSSVDEIEPGRTRWVAREAGLDIDWFAQTIEDVPGERITWRSEPGGRIETDGEVTFRPAPGDRGTEVRVRMRCAAPGGVLAMALAPLMRRFTRVQLGQDLHRMKQLIETGEVATGAMRTDQLRGGMGALSDDVDQDRDVETRGDSDSDSEAGSASYQRNIVQRAGGKNGRGAQR